MKDENTNSTEKEENTNSTGDGPPETDATVQPLPPVGADELLAIECGKLMLAPNILDDGASLVREMGVAGEDALVRLLYLVMTSRILDSPVSLAIKGESSGGKSFTLKTVLKLFPDSAYVLHASVSPMYIVRGEEPYEHRMLVFEEFAGVNRSTEYFLRILLSEGYVSHRTLVGQSNDLEPKTFSKPGPTGLVLTTTAISIHRENETRMLSVSITDTPEQTRNALVAMAKSYEKIGTVNVEAHRQFQEWMSHQPNKVAIPYLDRLAQLIAPVAMRVRRDFKAVVSLIRTHALLHRANRRTDEAGYIVATKADYIAVYDLMAELVSHGVDASVPSNVRETVEAVQGLLAEYPEGVPNNVLAAALGLHEGTASRRGKAAIARGYLVNESGSSGKESRLMLGASMPIDSAVLPHPDEIAADDCTVAPDFGHTGTNEG